MNRSDWIMLLTLSILWGGSFLFVEIGLQAFAPVQLVWLRVGLATLTLLPVLAVTGVAFPGWRHWPALIGMSVLNNVVPFSLIAMAQEEISGSLAAILNATTPLFTLVVAHLATQDERITPARAVGLTLGFAGVVVMLAGMGHGGGRVAILASLAAALSYALAAVYGRRFRRMGLSPLATAFGQVTGSTLLLTPVIIFFDPIWSVPRPGLPVLSAVAALAVFSTALAYLLFFRVLASAGATNLSIVTFLIPVSATAMGAAVLGERLEPQHVAGFLMICAGLLIINGRVQTWRSR